MTPIPIIKKIVALIEMLEASKMEQGLPPKLHITDIFDACNIPAFHICHILDSLYYHLDYTLSGEKLVIPDNFCWYHGSYLDSFDECPTCEKDNGLKRKAAILYHQMREEEKNGR